MKINIYDEWIDYPVGRLRSFRLCKNPIKRFDTQSMTSQKIIQRLVSRRRELPQERQYLVVLRDKDYENALEGNSQHIYSFVKDCFVDQGLMSKIWGRKK